MTRFFKFRFLPLLLLILIMVARASAHPDSFDPTGPMDWELYAEDLVSFYTNTELARMATSPLAMDPMDNLMPSQLHPHANQPPLQPGAPTMGRAFNMDMERSMVEQQSGVQLDVPTAGSYVPAMAFTQAQVPILQTIETSGFGSSGQQWIPSSDDVHSAPALTGARMPFHSSPIGSRTLRNLHRHSVDQLGCNPPMPIQWPNTPELRHDTPAMDQFGYSQFPQGIVPNTSGPSSFFSDAGYGLPSSEPSPHIMQQTSTGYLNTYTYPPTVNPPVESMRGWALRAPTLSDHTPLRIDTTHLAPPPLPTDRSAANSAAPTSSSSSPHSSRRHRWPQTLGARPYTCDICRAGFDAQGELTHHLRCHQPYPERRHVCPHCTKRFQYRKDLTRHLPQHDPNRPRYPCPHAGCKFHANRGFGRVDHLERHLRTQHRAATAAAEGRGGIRRRRSH